MHWGMGFGDMTILKTLIDTKPSIDFTGKFVGIENGH